MLSLNLPLFPGTRETGREGGARSARPDARERGSSAGIPRPMSDIAPESQEAPPDSRSRAWGGGARQVRRSRTSQTDGFHDGKQPTAVGSRGCLALPRMKSKGEDQEQMVWWGGGGGAGTRAGWLAGLEVLLGEVLSGWGVPQACGVIYIYCFFFCLSPCACVLSLRLMWEVIFEAFMTQRFCP